MQEPREFICFDDFDNDGWGNSTIEREPPDEEIEDDENNEPPQE